MISEQTIPTRTYFAVYAALLVLTAVTVAAAFVDLGPLNTVAALAIALGKGLLVILYFMHVRVSGRLTWVFAGAGFYWLAIMIVFTLTDTWTRDWVPEP
jgi:cytochrome c oxidase subunit IV